MSEKRSALVKSDVMFTGLAELTPFAEQFSEVTTLLRNNNPSVNVESDGSTCYET